MRKILLVMIAVLAAGSMTLLGFTSMTFAHEGNHTPTLAYNFDNSTGTGTLDGLMGSSKIIHNGTHVLIAGGLHHDIHVFHPNGTFIDKFGGGSTSDRLVYNPQGIAHNGTHIFVSTGDSAKGIQTFHSNGTHAGQFGASWYSADGEFDYDFVPPDDYVWGSPADAQVLNPGTIVHNGTHVLLTEGWWHRLNIFNPDATRADTIGNNDFSGSFVGGGNHANSLGELYFPNDVHHNGTHILVVDSLHYKIKTFTPDGTLLDSMGVSGGRPANMDIINDHILVTVPRADIVWVLHQDGSFAGAFGSVGTPYRIFGPWDLAHNGTHIFVTNPSIGQVQAFVWPASNEAGPSPPPATVPGAPANLTASNGTPAHSAVNLDWDAPQDGGSTITDYVLSLGMNCTGCDIDIEWQSYSDPISNATSAIVSGLSNATQYWFQVAAVNSVGQGTYSQATSHTTADMPVRPPVNGTDPNPPDPPLLVRAEFGEGKYLQVEYSENVVAASGAYSRLDFGDAIRDVPSRSYAGSIHHLNYAGELVRTDRTGNIATLGIDPTKIYRPTDEQRVFPNQTDAIPVNNPYPPPNPVLPSPPDPPQDLDDLIDAVSTLQAKMTRFEALLTGMNDRITDLQNAVTGMNSTIAQVNSTVAAQDAKITMLEEQMDELSSNNGTGQPPVNGTNPDPPEIGTLADAIESLRTTVTDLVSRVVVLEHASQPAPEPPESTGVSGNVFRDVNSNGALDPGEPGIPGRTVIAVNTADHSDVKSTDTDSTGYYSFDLSPGGYLVQVIGGGSQGYAYVTVSEGQMLVLNLIP